jgi:hypothetical protein
LHQALTQRVIGPEHREPIAVMREPEPHRSNSSLPRGREQPGRSLGQVLLGDGRRAKAEPVPVGAMEPIMIGCPNDGNGSKCGLGIWRHDPQGGPDQANGSGAIAQS